MKSLSYKIGLGYFILITINLAMAAFAIYHIHRLSQPLDTLLKENYRNVVAAQSMMQALERQESVQFSMIEYAFDSSKVTEFQSYGNEFFNWHQRAVTEISLAQEVVILDSLQNLYNAYRTLSETLQTVLKNKRPYSEVKAMHTKRILPLVREMEGLCRRLKEVNQQALSIAEQKANRFSRRANVMIAGFAFFALLISVLAGIYFTRKIITPIRRTTMTVRRISHGHLNLKVVVDTDDEIAELGQEFNKMTERLDAYEKMNVKKIISEKKKSEAIVSGLPVGLVVINEQNQLTLLNEQAKNILNIQDSNWVGCSIYECIKNEKLHALFDGLGEEEGEGHHKLISVENESGKKSYLVRQIEIEGGANERLGKITLFEDVTHFKNLDELKSEFISTISHELRTPLTSLNMTIDILMRGLTGNLTEEQKSLLKNAKDDLNRLKQFVKELLELSRLESGRFALDREKVIIGEIIKDAVESLRLLQNQKAIRVEMAVDSDLPEVEGDFRQLARVVTNLLKNAYQYSPQNSTVRITAGKEKAGIRLCVTDEGPGIPQSALKIIFDKFIFLERENESSTSHVGLGLSIARGIVKAHGGYIWAESEEGKGSRFCFWIPSNKTGADV